MDDLVRGLQAGDRAAFDRLVREQGDPLYRFVRRMTGDRWADDVVQEVFIRVHRSVGSFEPTGPALRSSTGGSGGGRFRAWLFAIASRLCIDHLRRRRTEELPEDRPDARMESPSAAAEGRELKEAILRAVERLPVDQRQVFLLREEAGL